MKLEEGLQSAITQIEKAGFPIYSGAVHKALFIVVYEAVLREGTTAVSGMSALIFPLALILWDSLGLSGILWDSLGFSRILCDSLHPSPNSARWLPRCGHIPYTGSLCRQEAGPFWGHSGAADGWSLRGAPGGPPGTQ